jgi:hypothetical protein
MNQKPENKNQVRDLMEYILLISFVCLGSSFVAVSEFHATRDTGKNPGGLPSLDASKARRPRVIFGQQTKRHIK